MFAFCSDANASACGQRAQSAARADGRLPGIPMQRRAHLCCRRACQLLRPGGAGLAPHAVLRRLQRTCACRLAGHWADSERKGQAAAGPPVGAGSAGVASRMIDVRVAALLLTGGPGACSQSSESLRLRETRSRRLRDEYRTASCRCCAICQGLRNTIWLMAGRMCSSASECLTPRMKRLPLMRSRRTG